MMDLEESIVLFGFLFFSFSLVCLFRKEENNMIGNISKKGGMENLAEAERKVDRQIF